ncbi:hypothetical protein PCE1_000141 [Barthelona sp. PCE]
MKFFGLLIFLLISSNFLSARATILSAEGCTTLVRSRLPQYAAFCRYPAYRTHLGAAVDRVCGGTVSEACVKRIMSANGGDLDRAIPRTNSISNSKIAIVDGQKYTEIITETIDIPGLGLPTEDILPTSPIRDGTMRGQPASISFGSIGRQATVLSGVFDPETAQFWMDSVSRPPVPVYSNVPFTLTELNPQAACHMDRVGFFGKQMEVCQPWVTSSENPSIEVYIPNDEEFKVYGTSSVVELKLRLGDVNLLYSNDNHLIKYENPFKKVGFFGRFRSIAVPAHVQLHHINGSGAFKHGDIISFCRDGERRITIQGFFHAPTSIQCPRFRISTE